MVAIGVGLFMTHGDGLADQAAKPSDTTKLSQGEQTEAKAFAKAEAVKPIYEFKPVLDGEIVTHTFVIKNTGNAELKILKVRTG